MFPNWSPSQGPSNKNAQAFPLWGSGNGLMLGCDTRTFCCEVVTLVCMSACASCRYATYYPVMLAHNCPNSYKYTLLQGSILLHCKKRLRSFSLCPSLRGIRRPNKATLAASTQSDALSGPTPKLKEANTGKILAQFVSGNKTWNRESPSVGGRVNVVVAKMAVKRK